LVGPPTGARAETEHRRTLRRADTATWIEQQRAAAKKADIERVAYANTVLDVVLADTDKLWTVPCRPSSGHPSPTARGAYRNRLAAPIARRHRKPQHLGDRLAMKPE